MGMHADRSFVIGNGLVVQGTIEYRLLTVCTEQRLETDVLVSLIRQEIDVFRICSPVSIGYALR